MIAQGLRVSVYEQASVLGEVGAGVFLTPNSVRQLQRVGLGPSVEQLGARVGASSHYFRHDGAPIAPVQVTDSSGWNATFGMHRADLVEMLAAALPPGVVRTGHRGIGCEQIGDVARVSQPFANDTRATSPICSQPIPRCPVRTTPGGSAAASISTRSARCMPNVAFQPEESVTWTGAIG